MHVYFKLFLDIIAQHQEGGIHSVHALPKIGNDPPEKRCWMVNQMSGDINCTC